MHGVSDYTSKLEGRRSSHLVWNSKATESLGSEAGRVEYRESEKKIETSTPISLDSKEVLHR